MPKDIVFSGGDDKYEGGTLNIFFANVYENNKYCNALKYALCFVVKNRCMFMLNIFMLNIFMLDYRASFAFQKQCLLIMHFVYVTNMFHFRMVSQYDRY